MARNPTNRLKDLCTIEQSSYIAQEVIKSALLVGPGLSVVQCIEQLAERVKALEMSHAAAMAEPVLAGDPADSE